MSFKKESEKRAEYKTRRNEEGNEYPEEDANIKSMKHSESVYDEKGPLGIEKTLRKEFCFY